ncbi:hypothetical protein [Denitromonas iodatirespirans]|uniref:Uncharacterized protein n=1 Tax=Denitromonas iodatirespirans TaxID=2795389 RepID=A0A944H8G9_DENI1|nr:hypothetical protein [Denitromonas iodatirespirans]MBT0962199.1 hypothetical protein [Denitromonas iodatirespirans]
MSPETMEALMEDIEREDPLDFGMLSMDEHEARCLMANHFCEVDRQLASSGLDAEARLEVMAAIAAHAMVENMLLNVQRLQDRGAGEDVRAWMRRHGMG